MKLIHALRASVLAPLVAVPWSNGALAESTYGYAAAGTGTVTATARVNLSVTVAKLILLRVGSANAVVDTAAWTFGASIPAVPTASVNGNNTGVNWDGTAPTLAASTSPAAFTVYAWTNSTTPSINCLMGTWSPASGGPTNPNFTVLSAGSLAHPGGNLGACTSTVFSPNIVATGTWQYVLGGTPGAWSAGVYTNTITYTAQGL